MNKADYFSFSVALIINLILLILIPGLKAPEISGSIKVGLVSTSNQKNAAYQGQKETVTKEPPKPTPAPPKVEQEKPVVQEPKKELSLDSIQIAAPKIDSAAGKKAVSAERITSNAPVSESVAQALDAPIKTLGNVPGIPSGYKLGSTDGDIDAKWDEKNREPEYPLSAQQRGINGSVTLVLNIDSGGNIRQVSFQKRSGYVEIDSAIEVVARTWKIYLTKNGKTAQGTIVLDYNFRLIGN